MKKQEFNGDISVSQFYIKKKIFGSLTDDMVFQNCMQLVYPILVIGINIDLHQFKMLLNYYL